MFMLFMFYCFRKQTHTMRDQKRSEHSPHSSVAMSPNYTATPSSDPHSMCAIQRDMQTLELVPSRKESIGG